MPHRQKIVALTALGALLIAFSTMFSWAFNVPEMRTYIQGFPAMIPATAVTITLLSIALLLISQFVHSPNSAFVGWFPVRRWTGSIFALLAFALGITTLAGHAWEFQVTLDQFLFWTEQVRAHPGTLYSGRMSVQTSTVASLLSFTILMRPFRVPQNDTPVFQAVPLFTVVVTLLAITGYVHDVATTGPSRLIGMSLPTTLSFLLLSIGTLAMEPNIGFMGRLRSPQSEGVFLRWYTTFSVLAPILITILISIGERAELYPSSFSASLFVIFTIVGLFIIGLFMSVSVRRLEDQRFAIEQAQAAESANQIKTTFLANMSHEIRTPMGAILGFTELLSEPTATPEQKERYLEIISRNSKTLSHLINDILDLSKVEAGRLDIEVIRFQVRETIDEVLTLLKRNADERGNIIFVTYDDTTPMAVHSDPVRLKQILINLVGNAIKFTQSGRIDLRVSKRGSILSFEIEDTGIGISDAEREGLFRPFAQADGSSTRRFGGTGLGLVLSRRLAVLLGGSVSLVSSIPGSGSVFLATIEDRVNRTRSETVQGSLANVKVLLAEDSIDNQHLISHVLSKEGATVDTANDGRECLEKALTQDYDLVLMDIQMPVLDGYTATRQLRGAGFKKPIIALTAHAMSDVRDRCERAGCDSHLTKPIDRVRLIREISDFASRAEV